MVIKVLKMFFPIHKKRLAVSLILGVICGVGDKNSESINNEYAAAICDNVTHALLGAFTYVGTYITRTSNTDLYFILEIFVCAFFSSVIDADHFIAARSVHLKDATSLKNRPLMHCTTLILGILFSVLLLSYAFKLAWMYKFAWILAAAFFSHHIRDSKRRGFWLWPFGHTGVPHTIVYFIIQMFLPQILAAIISKFFPFDTPKVEFKGTVETV